MVFDSEPVSGSRSLTSLVEEYKNGAGGVMHVCGRRRLLEILLRASERLARGHSQKQFHPDLSSDAIMVDSFGEVSIVSKGESAVDSGSDVLVLRKIFKRIMADDAEEKLIETVHPELRELCEETITTSQEKNLTVAAFSERLGAYLRGEFEWETIRFGEEGRGVDLNDWEAVDGDWMVDNGVFISEGGTGEKVLMWQQSVPGPFHFVCEAWTGGEGELSLIGHSPVFSAKADVLEEGQHPGYYFQFGGDAQSSTRIMRNGVCMTVIRGLAPEPGRKYRLEMIYDGLRLICLIDGEKVFSFDEIFSFSGCFLGFYSYGQGNHFKPIEVTFQRTGITVPVTQLADDLLHSGYYEAARRRFVEIADISLENRESVNARFKAGICLSHTQQWDEARKAFKSIPSGKFKPYAMIEEARIDLLAGIPETGVTLIDEMISEFQGHHAVMHILYVTGFFRLRRFLSLQIDWKRDCLLRQQLMHMAVQSSEVKTRAHLEHHIASIRLLMETGQWDNVLKDRLVPSADLTEAIVREINLRNLINCAVLTSGQDDLLDVPLAEPWLFNSAFLDMTWGTGVIPHIVVRKGDPADFLKVIEDSDIFNSIDPPVYMLGDVSDRRAVVIHTVLALHLIRSDLQKAVAWVEDILIPYFETISAEFEKPVVDHSFNYIMRNLGYVFYHSMFGNLIIESGDEMLFSRWTGFIRDKIRDSDAGFKKPLLRTLQARFAVENGRFDEAAEFLKGLKLPKRGFLLHDAVVLQAMLASLGHLRSPGIQASARVAEQDLAGTELDLARIFLGKKDSEPDDGWPHPGWRPEWRLWLGLWLEAKGDSESARKVVEPSVDERYGLTHSQPAIRMLLSRI